MNTPTSLPPVPLPIRLALTVFVAVLIPVYARAYGLLHFLWLSDVALFLTLVAVWRTSPLLNSMMAVGILPLELIWNIDFFVGLAIGRAPLGLADYMFDPEMDLLLRGLSLFHVALPILWIWLLRRWGYDRRAWIRQTVLFWAVILTSYAVTDPDDNVNWVFSWQLEPLAWMPALAWLVTYLIGAPVLLFRPMHALLLRVCEPAPSRPGRLSRFVHSCRAA